MFYWNITNSSLGQLYTHIWAVFTGVLGPADLGSDTVFCVFFLPRASLFILVLCEYSNFRIESNSYLLFDSIRNWRNYSQFSNTYLTVISLISRAIDKRFVCTLPHSPVSWTQCCAACVPTPPTPLSALTTHACTHAREAAAPRHCSQCQVSTVTSDGVITAGGKHSARSVERWTFCQYCYGFSFNTETCCI